MDAELFVAAVQEMVGLPPVMREHLIKLAPKLTDEQRAETMAKVTAMHHDIIETSDELLKEVDAGEKEMREFEHVTLPKMHQAIEKEEHEGAESILDDSPPSLSPL